MLDVWGRAEGFLVMVCFATLGLILMAVSHNLATFCAAQVSLTTVSVGVGTDQEFKIFYAVGFSGIIYIVCVLAADATNLRNRGLAFVCTLCFLHLS